MPLTHKQQTILTTYLGFLFLLMFTAFNSLQNIVSKIYNQYGYDNLGQTSILLLYLAFSLATFFTPYVIRKMGYKAVMFYSSLGYSVYEGLGLLVAMWENMPKWMGWILVLIGALICGVSASMLWVAQGSYLNEVAGNDRKSERKTQLNGIFWSLFMSSQITGSLLTTFVLGMISTTAYFIVLTTVGFACSFMFLLLPDLQKVPIEEREELTLPTQIKKVTAMLRNPKHRSIIIYYFFPGLCVGFYATFIYRLVAFSIAKEADQTAEQHNQRISFYSGLVFIAMGVSQGLTGLIIKTIARRYAHKYDKYKMAVVGTLLVEIAGYISLLCFFLNSYGLCFAVSALWGCAETFLQTNTNPLIGDIFPGQVEAFSTYRIVFAMGVVLTILLNIALKEVPAWVFLTIVMAIQILTNWASINLPKLKVQKIDQSQSSLLSAQESKQ